MENFTPQDPNTRGVERGDPHLLRHGTDQASNAFAHLAGSLVGEGDRQYLEGRDTLVADQVGDPVREYPGLARTRSCHHQQRTLGMGDGLVLGRVETIEQRVLGGSHLVVVSFAHQTHTTGPPGHLPAADPRCGLLRYLTRPKCGELPMVWIDAIFTTSPLRGE
jgi:hypothetical protein